MDHSLIDAGVGLIVDSVGFSTLILGSPWTGRGWSSFVAYDGSDRWNVMTEAMPARTMVLIRRVLLTMFAGFHSAVHLGCILLSPCSMYRPL